MLLSPNAAKLCLTCLPSQIPEVPSELKEWSENTALGTFAGMLYCGGRQFLANRREGEL
jgi:hypothetical protein